MTILTFQDFLRTIAKSLQISTSFPAALFVFINAYFVFPSFISFEPTGLQATTLIISATLIISYLLNALNYPLIRVLEGYKCKNTRPMIRLRAHEQERFQEYLNRLNAIEVRFVDISERLPLDFDTQRTYKPSEMHRWHSDVIDADVVDAYRDWTAAMYDYSLVKAEMEANFPSNQRAILATPLGNVIAAFEDYSYTRYGMDSIALWPRLLPVLRKSRYIDFVVQEKSTFDFLLYMMVVTLILGPELAYVQAFFGSLASFFGIMALAVLAVFVLYQALIVSAQQWGNTVRVAFDLHRSSLFSSLRLKPVKTIDEERQRWRDISSFFTNRQDSYPAPFLRTSEVESNE